MNKEYDLSQIGSKLQELIDSKNLTHEKFAELFHTTARTVRRWVKEGINKIDLLIQIAKFFEVNYKDLL